MLSRKHDDNDKHNSNLKILHIRNTSQNDWVTQFCNKHPSKIVFCLTNQNTRPFKTTQQNKHMHIHENLAKIEDHDDYIFLPEETVNNLSTLSDLEITNVTTSKVTIKSTKGTSSSFFQIKNDGAVVKYHIAQNMKHKIPVLDDTREFLKEISYDDITASTQPHMVQIQNSKTKQFKLVDFVHQPDASTLKLNRQEKDPKNKKFLYESEDGLQKQQFINISMNNCTKYVPDTIGLQWVKIDKKGAENMIKFRDETSTDFQDALRTGKIKFTKKQRKDFGIENITSNNFVEVDDNEGNKNYFKPDVDSENKLVKCETKKYADIYKLENGLFERMSRTYNDEFIRSKENYKQLRFYYIKNHVIPFIDEKLQKYLNMEYTFHKQKLKRTKQLALVAKLMKETLLRPGNESNGKKYFKRIRTSDRMYFADNIKKEKENKNTTKCGVTISHKYSEPFVLEHVSINEFLSEQEKTYRKKLVNIRTKEEFDCGIPEIETQVERSHILNYPLYVKLNNGIETITTDSTDSTDVAAFDNLTFHYGLLYILKKHVTIIPDTTAPPSKILLDFMESLDDATSKF